jgi:hypothetical protein
MSLGAKPKARLGQIVSVARAREEFDHDPTTFETNFSR